MHEKYSGHLNSSLNRVSIDHVLMENKQNTFRKKSNKLFVPCERNIITHMHTHNDILSLLKGKQLRFLSIYLNFCLSW